MSPPRPAPRRPAVVSDPDDERLEAFRNLRDPDARRRIERDRDVFVVEGPGALAHLLASRWPVRAALFSPAQAASHPSEMDAALAQGAAVHVVGPAVMAGLVGFAFHRGVLALGVRQPDLDAHLLVTGSGPGACGPVVVAPGTEERGRRRMVVIEGVNDHENLGALFRNAAAFGAQAVLLDPTCADPLYRRSVRVSVGHVLRVPWARCAPWPAALGCLGPAGWVLVALTPDRSAPPLDAANIVAMVNRSEGSTAGASGTGVALMVGAEGPGLTEGAIAAADVVARLPMADGVDSLNVATAAAVALYAIGR